ncbi:MULTISPECIES: pyridoxamine 5'-phosphate oxidase family protein [Actinosynnema]|uniref:pyridoxamine 5'-phosphate oxidase family protein n=1 Tax=Actinosynnema TaxID=40566 RepID=UPI0020A367F9|nr:pyridoxamine 5'-phosphate oxidase family protein [Actinosynnema pretiosum]MCP2097669.1 hypothetical protein [Actinosynnema pretiosum]
MTTRVDRLAYHPGELAAQRAAGLTELAARIRPIISDALPPAAQDFLARQTMLVLGARDREGRPWATTLLGHRGFLSAPTPRTLRATAAPLPTDPLAEALRHETDVGALAIDLAARRRFRVNGRWRPTDTGGEIDVHQAFGNCPKHIQSRVPTGSAPPSREPVVRRTSSLGLRASLLVASADTFFIATSAPTGADVSHRGGDPGFVTPISPTELVWPDYGGNAMLMTNGNLTTNPEAGLLFPDWNSGATLQLTGAAEVRPAATPALPPSTGRETVFRITEAVWTEHAFPAHWSEPSCSRFNRAP